MGSTRTVLWATLLTTFTAAAQAAAHWVCGVSGAGTQLICVADTDAGVDRARANPPALTAIVNGTRFPLDPARTYTVDMWSPPTEEDFVVQLARATICYRSPGCQVTLAPGPWLAAAGRR